MTRIAALMRWTPRAALLIALLVAPTGCGGGSRSVDTAAVGSALPVATTRGDDIGLTGRVTASYGPYVFAVGSGRERVVVVTPEPLGAAVGSDVEVAGRVETFRRRDLEMELGVDLGPQTDELENGSCLVATTARVV